MNDWFKKFIANIKEKWANWKPLQKGIAIGIVVVVIGAIVALATISSKDTSVKLFSKRINDDNEIAEIQMRLDQDHVWNDVRDGFIYVKDQATANRYVNKLVAEGIEPKGLSPYDLWGTNQWSRNEFDDKVKWQQTMERRVKNQLESFPEIRSASVNLSLPDEAIFSDNQKPVTASVVIFPYGGSDILENKKQILALQHLIMRSVEGLSEDEISIVNGNTNLEVNDFEGMLESDKISLEEKRKKLELKQEGIYTSKVLELLDRTYRGRVNVANMKINMDFSERSINSVEYSGITIVPDNPDTPYDDSKVVETLPLSFEKVDKSFTGTGFNPEGPAGMEGNTSPVYEDMSNVIGKSTETGVKQNNALNQKNITETLTPVIKKVSFSVNIDSFWGAPNYEGEESLDYYKEYGFYPRKEIKLTQEEIDSVTKLVRSSIGYDRSRGDEVTVTNIPWDHSDDWIKIDTNHIKAEQRKKTIMWSILGVAVVLVAFILFRIISREIERKRRLREEELLRKQQAEREQALWDAKNEGMEVTMSVEERKRAELQENAIAMAKEHPEDVAMLIRTWLMEE